MDNERMNSSNLSERIFDCLSDRYDDEEFREENINDLYIDMWFGDAPEEADKITISFYPIDAKYRGNIYKNGKIIGDYVCSDSLLLEKVFPQLQFNWV